MATAYRLLKDGKVVHTARASSTLPSGRKVHRTKARVGHAGQVFTSLPDHMVEEIENDDGETWEIIQIDSEGGDEETHAALTPDPSRDHEGTSKTGVEAQGQAKPVVEAETGSGGSGDSDNDLSGSGAGSDDSNSAETPSPEGGGGQTEPEPQWTEETPTRELENLLRERGVDTKTIKGSGAQGKVIKEDLINALRETEKKE